MITDTDRLNYLLQFISVDDVGDEEYVMGVVVETESLEEQLTFGPLVGGKMLPNVKTWTDSIRDVIDRAILAHRFPASQMAAGIVNRPCSDGFYWWRGSDKKDWELSEVTAFPFRARFFNGSRIWDNPWGEWKKAEIVRPNTEIKL